MSKRKIKVLVLTSSFPRFKNDWWQQAILSIYSNMDQKKYDITVISPSSPGARSSEDIEGIHVRRFLYFYPKKFQLLTSGEGVLYTSRNKKILGKIQVITFIISEFLFTMYVLMKENFDVIHANWILPQGFVAVLAKFIFQKPAIVTVHGTDIFALKKFNFLKAFILKHCDICTTNSSATYSAAYEIYPKANLKIVQMGVDIDMFNPRKKDSKWREEFGKNPKIILGVGRLIKWKGFEYLIKAFPPVLIKFPEAKLVIIGKGSEEGNLKKLAQKLSLKEDKNIFFPGHFSYETFPIIYASCDLVVCPSITIDATGEKEGQGNVALEARASGTPVIASRSGGLVDTIDDNVTGLLFREKDFRELAKKIVYILSNKAIRERLSRNGLNLVREKYAWGKTSDKFEQLYEIFS